ncbi:PTS cellobiose transporter subunit IIC [Enterococcus avium]|uniref:PTS cellobiose transporter subunit IIC n=1 Tax=Enterococcus avium TaxID=33945 RepID=UPI002A9139F0|nr:PTS cellobiose transporter subunit IIC [Enterococcus avium]MDY6441962.1 PTS cellobiose transporter subunit IIC [Enterococcus avium]MDY6447681.1 PTS cellobiose transporter subunit IIC [Enterococcus avium]MDY6454179.1 PTS cellobiose transporter subunit IIC [Enterococcus avium]MDY6474421.1 PTS cellobiose transporter subunit IIC [Enterococcus avium]
MDGSNNKVFAFLEKNLMGPMGKIASLKVVRAIMGAGMGAIPFTIVGSMFLVFNILPMTFPFLEGIFNSTFFKFESLYMLANSTTMGILALYFCVGLGYEYTKIIAEEEEELNMAPITGALLSIFAFFLSIPQLMMEKGSIVRLTNLDEGIINGWAIGGDGVSRLGTVGIFTGIIMAVIAVRLYRLCVKRNWVIKMPEQVPEGVSRAFTALIPAFVVAFVILIIIGILVFFNTDIFQLIAIPFGFVTKLTSSWIGVMVIYFLIHALWIVGIHGANIISSLIAPITLGNLALNADGAHIPLAGEFQNAFVTIGGSGATLGLCLFLVYMAKSEQLKVLGKASIVPCLFNINEPLIFGIPLIYNPFMAIPFFLAPMVSASIAYFAIQFELIRPVIANMPWPSPVGVGAFISTGGDWKAALVAIIGAVAAFVIYLPFARAYDKKLVDDEVASTEETAGDSVSV